MKRLLGLGGLCLAWALASGTAAAFERGTSGADFLKIGLGAAATGVGEAYTARSGDVGTMFYNPAGLVNLELNQLAATHLNWIADTQYEALAYARPMLGLGTLGAGIFMLHMPDIPMLDENALSQGNAQVYDLGVMVSYARDVSLESGINGLAGGINVKLLHRELAGTSASGAALDLGVLYRCTENLSLGVACQNLGYLSKFDQNEESLPLLVRVGGAYMQDFGQHRAAVMLDVIQAMDNTLKANLGMEYTYAGFMHLRAGYQLGYDANGFQTGAGVEWQNLSLDYAAKWMGLFGLTHYVSASVGFGSPLKDLQDEKINGILAEAQSLYTSSRYEEALKVTAQALQVDPHNATAGELKAKLETVLNMLKLTPGGEVAPEVPKTKAPLTQDQKEELGVQASPEVKP